MTSRLIIKAPNIDETDISSYFSCENPAKHTDFYCYYEQECSEQRTHSSTRWENTKERIKVKETIKLHNFVKEQRQRGGVDSLSAPYFQSLMTAFQQYYLSVPATYIDDNTLQAISFDAQDRVDKKQITETMTRIKRHYQFGCRTSIKHEYDDLPDEFEHIAIHAPKHCFSYRTKSFVVFCIPHITTAMVRVENMIKPMKKTPRNGVKTDTATQVRDELLDYPFRIISFIAYVFVRPNTSDNLLKNVYSWRDLSTEQAEELQAFDEAYSMKLSELYFGDNKYKDYFHGTIEHVAYRDQCLALHYSFQHPASIYVERPWRHFNVCLVRQTLQRIIVSNGEYCNTLRETFVSDFVFKKYYQSWFEQQAQYLFVQALSSTTNNVSAVSAVSTLLLDCVRYRACLENLDVTTATTDKTNLEDNISMIYKSLQQLPANYEAILLSIQQTALSHSIKDIEQLKKESVNQYLQSLAGETRSQNIYQEKTVDQVVVINIKDIEQMENEQVQRVNDFEFWLDITYWLNMYRFMNEKNAYKASKHKGGGQGPSMSRRIRHSHRKCTRVHRTKAKARLRSRRVRSVVRNRHKKTVKALCNKRKGGEELADIAFDELHQKGMVVCYVHRSFTAFRIVIAKDRDKQWWYIEMRHKQSNRSRKLLKLEDVYRTGAGGCGFMKYNCKVGNMFCFKAKKFLTSETWNYSYSHFVERAKIMYRNSASQPPNLPDHYANFMLSYWNGYHPVWYTAIQNSHGIQPENHPIFDICSISSDRTNVILPGMDRWLLTVEEVTRFVACQSIYTPDWIKTFGGSLAKLLAWKIPPSFRKFFCRTHTGVIVPILWIKGYNNEWANELVNHDDLFDSSKALTFKKEINADSVVATVQKHYTLFNPISNGCFVDNREESKIDIDTNEIRFAQNTTTAHLSYLKGMYLCAQRVMKRMNVKEPSTLFHILFNFGIFQILHLKLQDVAINKGSFERHDSTFHETFRRGISCNLTEMIDCIEHLREKSTVVLNIAETFSSMR